MRRVRNLVLGREAWKTSALEQGLRVHVGEAAHRERHSSSEAWLLAMDSCKAVDDLDVAGDHH